MLIVPLQTPVLADRCMFGKVYFFSEYTGAYHYPILARSARGAVACERFRRGLAVPRGVFVAGCAVDRPLMLSERAVIGRGAVAARGARPAEPLPGNRRSRRRLHRHPRLVGPWSVSSFHSAVGSSGAAPAAAVRHSAWPRRNVSLLGAEDPTRRAENTAAGAGRV